MPVAPRLKLQDVCLICKRLRPLTFDDWCAGCAQIACGEGTGERAGLPPPHRTLDALWRLTTHLAGSAYQPDKCWPCALLTIWCNERDSPSGEMSPGDAAAHLLVGSRVVIGCEELVSAALRAFGMDDS